MDEIPVKTFNISAVAVVYKQTVYAVVKAVFN